MSSSPGLPPQQATTTNLKSTSLLSSSPQSQQRQQQQQQQQQQPQPSQPHPHPHPLPHHLHHPQPPLPTVPSTKSRKNAGEDSEAETVVLAEVVPGVRKNVEGPPFEYERGRKRRTSDVQPPADQDRPHRTRPLRSGMAKRRLKGTTDHNDEEYSSDLSSASRSSNPNSPSHPHSMRRRVKRDAGFQKRKANGASTASEGDNSDDGHHHNNRPRLRKRRRSVMGSSPPRLRIKSSPPVSPQPLGSPIKTTRSREKIHVGQRTLKYRKIPPPITTLGDRSSSSSRENSPSAIPRSRMPQSVRALGSPMSTSHKPRRDTAGRTHLHRACQRGAVHEVEGILSQGKEFLNAEDNAGYLPLHEACLCGHLEVVKILINNGAWLDVPSRMEQDTPLLDAVDNGHVDVVKYLLELGADPRKRNKQGQTALDANDSNRGTSDVFREIEGLLKIAINKLRTKRLSDDETARASAAADSHSSRDPSVTSPVHQSPPAPSVPTSTRRRGARTEQSRKDLLWLDAGKNGLQKLREKAREGDQQMVHALLERGTKPDTESLIGAIKGGHADTVNLLLAYGDAIADPDLTPRDGYRKTRDTSTPAGEETPMLAAIGRGNLTVLEYLLANDVDPTRRDSKGKTYEEIARDREGEFWQDEVEMLKKACEKANREKTRRHSPAAHRNTSPKPKKTNNTKAESRPRTNSSLSSARQSASANPTKYEEEVAVSDQETTAEPLGPPKNRGRKEKRSESDSLAPPVAKKKRRLISGKDLENEELLARSSQEPSRSVPSETDIDSSEKKSVAKKALTNSDDVKSEQKQPGRKLRMDPEDIKMYDAHAPVPERNTLKSRADHDSNLLKPDNIPSRDKKLPTLGSKRDRTRSPTSYSDSGRRHNHDDLKHQRKVIDHKNEKYDSDNTVKRVPVKEEGATSKRKLHPGEATVRRGSSHTRRSSLSTAESSEKEEERRRPLREKEEADRREREKRERAREEEEKRRAALIEAESKELRRQNHLKSELDSIYRKAREESKRAREDEAINRGLELRKKREEQERIERAIREKEEREQEEREAREREKREKEVQEAMNRRAEQRAAEAREREAREREVKEREAREKEAREREAREREARERETRERETREREAREREAEQKRLTEIKRREEERHEEERKREEARRLEEERQAEETRRRFEEELQKRLAEQRLKEEAEKRRQEALENQRRAAEAERKRKVAEEERKRQELEHAQREKEARDRRIAEQLQQQLAAERKRLDEELAKRRRLEEEERRKELARREALPFALRRAEENHANGTAPVESSRFLPLCSATFPGPYSHPPMANATPTRVVNGCGVKQQQWILNVQAALVLGVTDLGFSNYADIKHRQVTDQERLRMWSVLSIMLCERAFLSERSIKDLEKSHREERNKFLEMSPVFWIKVEDLKTIINTDPKYTHLANLSIRTVDVDLSYSNDSTPMKLNNGNGPMTPSVSITKEEMALRLERLFGTPPPRALQSPQAQAQSSPTRSTLLPSLHAQPDNSSTSMPPPTPVNTINAAPASASMN